MRGKKVKQLKKTLSEMGIDWKKDKRLYRNAKKKI